MRPMPTFSPPHTSLTSRPPKKRGISMVLVVALVMLIGVGIVIFAVVQTNPQSKQVGNGTAEFSCRAATDIVFSYPTIAYYDADISQSGDTCDITYAPNSAAPTSYRPFQVYVKPLDWGTTDTQTTATLGLPSANAITNGRGVLTEYLTITKRLYFYLDSRSYEISFSGITSDQQLETFVDVIARTFAER